MKYKLSIVHRGYIALVTVLIIGAVGIAIVSAAILSSLSRNQTTLIEQESKKARALADACSEHALIKLKTDLNYSGNEVLEFKNGKCKILPIEGTGNTNRIIKTQGMVDKVTRKNLLNVQKINPDLIIQSWKEVKNF